MIAYLQNNIHEFLISILIKKNVYLSIPTFIIISTQKIDNNGNWRKNLDKQTVAGQSFL